MGDRLILLDGSRLPAREEIGGKAWGIARMRRLGLTVPPAFVLPTSACRDYYARGRVLCDEVWEAARRGVAALEESTGRTFGSGPRPLLLSVRSGAAVSMPGMMDTVLDLGINDAVEHALAAESGDAAYARDTHCRFIAAYGRIVLRTEVPADVPRLPHELRRCVEDDCGRPVPDDPWQQLRGAIAAVFDSWQSARARAYRRHWGIPEDGGTAVTVQAMVFGNLDERSGTGVLFTRNPLSGDREPYGEYLPRGQGEDVVSGEHDPLGLDHLKATMPDVHRELVSAGRTLERESGDAQDIEFTVEQGRLYLLQARVAKRSPQAAVAMAVDLVHEGIIDAEEALRRVTPDQVRTLLRPRIDPDARAGAEVVAGEPACPGIAQGIAVADADEADRRAAEGEEVVFVAPTTSPEDVHGMIAATGVCTEAGGSTSHAAVVSRSLGRPCVVGCGADTVTRLAGQALTVDGETGEVFAGLLPLRRVRPGDDAALREITDWARERAPITVLGVDDPLPDEVVDLDEIEVVDPDALPAAVAGKRAARGRVLETDAGVRAAVAAGLRTIVVEQPILALLASLTSEEALPRSGRSSAVSAAAG